jgi:hypothetical protein
MALGGVRWAHWLVCDHPFKQPFVLPNKSLDTQLEPSSQLFWTNKQGATRPNRARFQYCGGLGRAPQTSFATQDAQIPAPRATGLKWTPWTAPACIQQAGRCGVPFALQSQKRNKHLIMTLHHHQVPRIATYTESTYIYTYRLHKYTST